MHQFVLDATLSKWQHVLLPVLCKIGWRLYLFIFTPTPTTAEATFPRGVRDRDAAFPRGRRTYIYLSLLPPGAARDGNNGDSAENYF